LWQILPDLPQFVAAHFSTFPNRLAMAAMLRAFGPAR